MRRYAVIEIAKRPPLPCQKWRGIFLLTHVNFAPIAVSTAKKMKGKKMNARTEYQALNKAARDLPRGPILDGVMDVMGSGEDNSRDGVEYESDEWFADVLGTIRSRLCDGYDSREVSDWFVANGVKF